MLAMLRSRLTYANVVATLALFAALGGSSYAAVKIKKNSVGSSQIKNNSIRSKDVKNKSLLGKDFKGGQLPKGAQGIPGIQGIQGVRGATGASGATNVLVRTHDETLDASHTTVLSTAFCKAGERATGGGAIQLFIGATEGGTAVVDSGPTGAANSTPSTEGQTPHGWTSGLTGGHAGDVARFYVICAKP